MTEQTTDDDTRPMIETQRLILRPFQPTDAPLLRELANNKEVADTTKSIPFPYPEGLAEDFIAMHPEGWKNGTSAIFAVCLKNEGEPEQPPPGGTRMDQEEEDAGGSNGELTNNGASAEGVQAQLIGAIGLEILPAHKKAELGYWLGKEYWNQGFTTEAARAVVAFGFEKLELNRIHAYFMVRNPASGRVMKKIGMTKEGVLRQYVQKWGIFEDVEIYGILRQDFFANT